MPIRSRILLVDDDPSMLETMKDVLSTRGYQMDTARSGPEALTRAAEKKFQFIIVDLQAMAPAEVEAVRQLGRLQPGVPVLLPTAGQSPAESAAARIAGVIPVHKPLEFGPLLRFIEQTLRPARVLMIDDDKKLTTMLGRFLTREGFETVVASDFEQGKKALVDQAPDAVLLAVHLPDRSGLDLLEVCRKSKLHPLIIISTGFRKQFQGQVERALKTQAYVCLEKPYQPSELVAALRRGLQEKMVVALQTGAK